MKESKTKNNIQKKCRSGWMDGWVNGVVKAVLKITYCNKKRKKVRMAMITNVINVYGKCIKQTHVWVPW